MSLSILLERKRREVELIEGIISEKQPYSFITITYNNERFAVVKTDERGTIILYTTDSVLDADKIASIVDKALNHQVTVDNVVDIR